MRTDTVLSTIENCFSFLDKGGFTKTPFVLENLEAGITYSDPNSDLKIVITYDKREHVIDCGAINKIGYYLPLYEILSQFPRDCSRDELAKFKKFCTMPVSEKNVHWVLDRIARIVDKYFNIIILSK